jgi:DNA uptake protein ComE-like DNA-binding protein
MWTFPLGMLSYISFFYAGYKVKQRKWTIAALIYAALFIITMVSYDIFHSDHPIYNVVSTIHIIAWIVSIVHAFIIRPEYLIRLEAMGSSKYDHLKKRVATETKQKLTAHHAINQVESPRPNMKANAPIEKGEVEERLNERSSVNINIASEAELARIPAIGSLYARRIISARNDVGSFKSFDHFVEVLSIKPHLAEKIRPHLSFPSNGKLNEGEGTREPNKAPAGRVLDF